MATNPWDDFRRAFIGGDYGRDRKTPSTTYSGTTQAPNPFDYGAACTAKDIQAAYDAIAGRALIPGNLAWISSSHIASVLHGPPSPPEDAAEITVESTGIEIGEIIAWRAWRIKDGVLISLVRDTPWLPNETVEGIIKGVGDHGKLRGIYSFKKASDAWNGCTYTNEKYVAGQVALWGEVVEHEKGYRAENARVHSIDFIRPETPENEILLKKLRRRYGLSA